MTTAAQRSDSLSVQWSQALRERHQHPFEFPTRYMIDALPAAIYITDAAGKITYFNAACIEFSGRTPELGTDHWCVTWKLFYPDGRPMPHDECPMAIALREGRSVRGAEAIAERPDGTRVCFMPYPTPLRDERGTIVGGINMLVDITERKAADETRARLAAIVDSSDDAIVSKDLNSVITSWNAGAQRLFGYTADEVIGQPITMLMSPDRVNEEAGILARIRQGERIEHYETVRRRKDGTLLDISLSVSPVIDSRGEIIGASKIARDISDRKRADERLQHALAQRTEEVTRAERALATSQRMAAVGTLAAGLAHDMFNLVTPLAWQVDGLLKSETVTDDVREEISVVTDLLDHLKQLAQNLSLFARDPDKEGIVGRTNIAQWHSSVHTLLDASVGRAFFIKWDCPPAGVTVPDAALTPHRLTQAVQNLIHNARDAVLAAKARDPKRMPRITVEARPAEDANFILLTVADNGIGMDEQTIEHCIEPFFTTRDRPNEPGQTGSGLGLSLAHQIVERAGGSMHIQSTSGMGTTITLKLPAAS